jgi:hypothetical protein
MLALVGLTLWGVAAGAAEIKVDYDKQADFTRYKTWSWRRGTPAPNPVADKRLREAIESRLAARGFSRVESGGDLAVVYHAAAENDVSLEKLGYKDPEFGTEATRVRVLRVGTVLVDVIDASTGKVVWRGHGRDATVPAPRAVERMIDEGIEQLFRQFPPQS